MLSTALVVMLGAGAISPGCLALDTLDLSSAWGLDLT